MVLSLCLLPACAKRGALLPPIPPPMEASQGDPARDARSRLLTEAYRAFVQERYPAAALFFRRFVEGAPDSPRRTEARWWLGRTYEQLGDYRSAMAQYRLIVAGPLQEQVNGRLYEGHALSRLDELRQLQAGRPEGLAGQVALRVAASELPSSRLLTPWLEDLVQGGVTTLIVDPLPAQMPGHSDAALDSVKGLVGEAHRSGLQLWLTLDLHQGSGMELRQEWLATRINGSGPGPEPTVRPDILNGVYQAYLEQLARAFARTGCDGLLLPARSRPGFSEEFSDGSFHAFTTAFGLTLAPDDVIAPPRSAGPGDQSRPVLYWRWVGWKALGYAKLVMRLRNALRETNPVATLLVEVHPAALTAPLLGLEQYGEDLAELSSHTGGWIVMRQDGVDGEALLQKVGQQAGMMDRLWLGVSVKTTSPLSMEGLSQVLPDLVAAGRWNRLVVHAESSPPVP